VSAWRPGDPEGKRLQSVFSVMMDLERRELSVTDGPPCSSAYFQLERLGEPVTAL
jgi:hypothetical protein